MNTLNIILDKAKEVCLTDLATAERLGVTRSAVSVWRKGGKISPEHLDKLISVSGADPALALHVLAEQAARTSNTWAAVAKRLAAAVVPVLAVAAVPYLGANAAWTAARSQLEQSQLSQDQRSEISRRSTDLNGRMPIMSVWGWCRRKLRQWRARRAGHKGSTADAFPCHARIVRA